jgi:magnesium chelatase family protein
MQEVTAEDKSGISSAEMKKQVNRAFVAQKERGQPHLNGKLREDEVEKYCTLSKEVEKILFSAIERFGLSHRSIGSIKKVARTIADLEPSVEIEKKHLLEALSYRRR